MGRLRGGGPRALGAVLTAALVAGGGVAVPAAAAAGGSGAPNTPATTRPPATTTTLPALPKVPLTYTDGQSPQTLLSNAISLSSLGLDDSALMKAVSATQAKLDEDAVTARNARAEADAASRREGAARKLLDQAQGEYTSMAGAVRQAVVDLYMSGPASLSISPKAGELAIYAQDYATSTIGPYGILARRQAVQQQRTQSEREVAREARRAATAAARAAAALADQRLQLKRLESELASASKASAADVAADHFTLAGQAGKELLADSALQFTPKTAIPAPVSTTPVALTWAFAQLGKQYVWGATGPRTFDCSGLTQFVWKAAGVHIPRVAADQDAWTIPVPLSDLLPGDLVFFGTTDIHHVGIYIGNGLMINAPHTGTVVQVSSIWWSDLAGFGRVHYPGTPVPPHDTPSPAQPAPPTVIAAAGPVPSQTAPPKGWKPAPGSSTPIRVGTPSPAASTTTTSTSTTSPSTSTTTSSTSTTTTAVLPGVSTTTTTPAPPAGLDGSVPTSTSSLPGT